MLIFGIFRGFPGLGRVSSGISILTSLRAEGHDVYAVSYLNGNDALKSYELMPFIDKIELSSFDINSIGINPITNFGVTIIQAIVQKKPDLIIIDGEPLLASTISDVYDPKKIINLLNPTDLKNDSLPDSTIKFFHKNYLSCGNAIVHGILLENQVKKINRCTVYYLNTILRNDVITIEAGKSKKQYITCILGGGTANSSNSFLESTIKIGKLFCSLATRMEKFSFKLFCNSDVVKKSIIGSELPSNIEIIDTYTSPIDMYKDSMLAIVRSGRNVSSELIYLKIPAILISSSGDYRSYEQKRNIVDLCNKSKSFFKSFDLSDSVENLETIVSDSLRSNFNAAEFVPGNQKALEIIHKIMEDLYE